MKDNTRCYNGKEYPCSTSLTMDIIGGKWKTVILYHLIEGKLRYNELRRTMPSVTEKTLSIKLKNLEEDGVVQRIAYGDKPPLRVDYQLTELGESLIPIIKSIANWGRSISDTI
ncbi:MAG: helix-turn-helix transcriptional regulator [Bacteroidales bacterium]|nr:helix-turn-helix transcriptional regulator [Bacteroidales bacterium]